MTCGEGDLPYTFYKVARQQHFGRPELEGTIRKATAAVALYADDIFPAELFVIFAALRWWPHLFPAAAQGLVEGDQVGIHGADALGQGVFGSKQRCAAQ